MDGRGQEEPHGRYEDCEGSDERERVDEGVRGEVYEYVEGAGQKDSAVKEDWRALQLDISVRTPLSRS